MSARVTGVACARVLLPGLLVLAAGSLAAPVEFDSRMLRQGTSSDLQRFEGASVIPEGEVSLDVTLNQRWMGRYQIALRTPPGAMQPTPCYGRELLEALGVDLLRLPPAKRALLGQEGDCLALSALGLEASEALAYGELRLTLSIARQHLSRRPVDHVDTRQWDSGVGAGFVNYDLNLHQQQMAHRQGTAYRGFLGLRGGLNTGDWYWRHDGILQGADDAPTRYQRGMTSVRRDLPALSAQLTLGDAASSSDVFAASAFRGLQLGSDERMLPQSRRGYAPTVRGVANSTALVSIRHRGVLLHESSVPPGPFEIDDLYPSGLSDDLEVTLKEADGSVTVFSVPFQAAPLALRPGARRFDFAGGHWLDGFGRTGPAFGQGSWQQGLDDRLSVHGGLWVAEDYLGGALGVALNTAVGAVGLTAYHADAAPSPEADRRGQAMRLNWRQDLTDTATRLEASISRSQSTGYLGFDQFAQARRGRHSDPNHWRASFSLDQALGPGAGRLSFAVNGARSWSGQGGTDYRLGYNNHFAAMAYGLNIGRQRSEHGQPLRTIALTLSMPLGERRRDLLSSAVSSDSRRHASTSLRWSSRAGEQAQWGYGLAAQYQAAAADPVGIDGNLRYRGSAGDLAVALGSRGDQRHLALGARGAVVAHGGGVTAAPTLGESFAIIHAPGATAARVRQQPQSRVDRRGYAVVPSLAPYSVNTVEIDPKGMPRTTELLVAGHNVVPRAGAAPLLRFATRAGDFHVLLAERTGGEALPFGAQVFDETGNEVGVVGQGGQVQIRSQARRGRLRISWGGAEHQTCWVDFEVGRAASAVAVCGPRSNQKIY